MSATSIRQKVTFIVAAILLAATMVAGNASPAAAECNSTEAYVEVLGVGQHSPTNGCVGPTDWGLLICNSDRLALHDGAVIVEAGACIALPF